MTRKRKRKKEKGLKEGKRGREGRGGRERERERTRYLYYKASVNKLFVTHIPPCDIVRRVYAEMIADLKLVPVNTSTPG